MKTFVIARRVSNEAIQRLKDTGLPRRKRLAMTGNVMLFSSDICLLGTHGIKSTTTDREIRA
jgi:UDP-N-acetylmuramate-alanine ligase